jgi:triphosphoribosyl-dephospho-CoA synthetase
VSRAAEEIFSDRERLHGSHGDLVRKEHPRSGIVTEALDGLPGLFDCVLPHTMRYPDDIRGVFMAMAELMLYVDDSTTRHRCGDIGIDILRAAGKELKQCLLAGNDYIGLLTRLDGEFRQQNLTMGGVADLLGVGLGYAAYLQQL